MGSFNWSIRGRFRLLLLLLCVLAFSACASLPDVGKLIAHEAGTNVPLEIIGPQGRLSAAESFAAVERLRRGTGPTNIIDRNLALMQSVSGTPLFAGNKVTLLVDKPATYAAIFDAIRQAKYNINLETYAFDDDEIGRALADLLLKRQEEGVQVNLICDSAGTLRTPREFFDRMREGGIRVLEFNPIDPTSIGTLWSLTHRDHRKILVVDGTVAFTGSVNIGALDYDISGLFSGKKDRVPWREIDVQIEGPAVTEFQTLFMETWETQQGPQLPEGNYFPNLDSKGDELVRVIGSVPGRMLRLTYIIYVAAVIFAEHSIHITDPYFVPDDQTLKALMDAAGRGVDVKIVLPHMSDHNLILYAGQYYYTRLLKAGVKLYERHQAVLHSKTAVVDGVWSTVGSTNLDLWSFLRNDEVNAVILSHDFASRMEDLFAEDLAQSDQVHLDRWRKRSITDRAMQWLGHLFRHWL